MRMGRGLIGPLLGLFGAWLLLRDRLDLVEVRGRSMAPALLPGDRLLLARLARPPRVGEVVVAPDPRQPQRELIKRVAEADRESVTLRGDNPASSTDARTFGAVPVVSVRWRVVLRYWPLGRTGRIPAAVALELAEEGGEAACAFPESLVAGP